MDLIPGRISVVIPAYNQEAYICDALSSLTRQKLGRWELEVLVVDDASDDQTAALVSSYQDRLPGLRLISLPENSGVSAARNAGLEQVTGEYFTFLDPDDWYSCEHLMTMAESLTELHVDFVRCDHVRVTGTNRVIHRAPQALRGMPLDPADDIEPVDSPSMVDYTFVWAGMYRTELMRTQELYYFDSQLHSAEDRLWLWKLHLTTSKYAVVSSPGVFYRRGLPGSLTQVFDQRQLGFIPAYAQILNEVRLHPDAERHLPKAMRQFFAIVCHHEKRAKNYPPEVRLEMKQKLRQVFTTIDAPLARQVALEMDVARRRHILSFLQPGQIGAAK
ncbi:glycosyltransferase family 2 protein [Glutamicibacter halophytocola]|uniref:Glycosyltransferase n=2 Tax=Glutamicibacter halophytocola TaxID=1933880 RepID=A0A5B8IPV2_9MICC|nr:glycosyltransferase family 2 protein [Glutamicibacter halophytocola]QDY66911.1 glycosyltransferase family 2 protein [Glutamicibacter halophytocola]UUX59056.1 glycosyltransferase [Glutamicibacter halophytocola]